MNCQDCVKTLFDYRWGDLDGMAANQVKSHLDSGCEQCNLEFELVDSLIASLADVIQPIIPPAELKEAIFKRIGITNQDNAGLKDKTGASASEAVSVRRYSLASSARLPNWMLQLAGCLLGALFGYSAYQILTDRTDEGQSQVTTEEPAPFRSNKAIRFITLQNPEQTDSQAWGTVVFDTIGRQIHVLTSQIAPDESKATYDVWLTSEDGINLQLGALTTSGTPGVRFNVFSYPDARMLVSQISIVKTNEATGSFNAKDIALVVSLSPPVELRK